MHPPYSQKLFLNVAPMSCTTIVQEGVHEGFSGAVQGHAGLM
jgi:hypothetical protein